MTAPTLPPAYGGAGWQARATTLQEELGSTWAHCGLDSEWLPLKSVILHRPGRELEAVANDATASLMLNDLDPGVIPIQHDALAQAYRSSGVDVFYVQPPTLPPPNPPRQELSCNDRGRQTLAGGGNVLRPLPAGLAITIFTEKLHKH